MEVDDGLLLLVDGTVHGLRPAVQHDLELMLVVTEELHRERLSVEVALDFPGPGLCDVDGQLPAFHFNVELTVIAPIANLFPDVCRVVVETFL